MTELSLVLPTPHDTQAFAEQLATLVRRPAVLALTGNLGSGKTTFTQAFARALGVTEPITSPTFTLMNEYTTPQGVLVHADLYRLHDASEIAQLGLADYFDQSNAVTVVEWADRLPSLFPASTLWLAWESTPKHHTVLLRTDNHPWWEQLRKVYA